ncbi:MAG: hypothetical protein ACTII7_09760 [Galactobacter sp.]
MAYTTTEDDTWDWFWLLIVGLFVLPFSVISSTVRSWLVDHHILVPANDAIVAIHAWNIGLDWPRLLLVAFVFLTAIALTAAAVRHRRARGLTQ